MPVEDENQRQHRGGIEHDPPVPPALVPRHAFADHAVQDKPVNEDRPRRHERRDAPRQKLQRQREEAENDVQELSQSLIRFKPIIHRFNSLQ